MPATGRDAFLHAELISREDSLALYGFSSEEERDLFRLLITVSGVGPKVAIATLSGGSARDLLRAIAAGDAKRFQAVPGIGKRTAERIIVELREKVAGALEEEVALAGGRGAATPASLARDGLVNLGYAPLEAEQLLDGVEGSSPRSWSRRRCARPAPRGTPHERPARTSAATGSAPRESRASRCRSTPRSRSTTPAPRLPTRISTARCGRRPWRTSSTRPRSPTSWRSSSRRRKRRGEPLDHVLLAGPPGLGKTSLAHIVAAELGVPMVQTAGPALERKADVASFLTALEPGSVFFIDEIHRLGRAVEETLYPAMEDGELPVVLGQGAGARTVTLPLPPFTLVGATTRAGLLTTPLRDRFGVSHRLEYYAPEHLALIVERSAGDPRGRDRRRGGGDDRLPLARHAAGRQPAAEAGSRLRPGEGQRADRRRASPPTRLEMLEVDAGGLDRSDRALLETIATKFGGGPVGLSTLAVAIGEEQDTIEDVLEPYLLQQGLLKRTPRGRVLTQRAYEHLGLPAPEGAASLF